jgi:hypothetical protein
VRLNETKKMRSRSHNESLNTISATESMKHSVLALLLVLAFASGCNLFPTKSKKVTLKELPPSAGIEAEFRDRWIDSRVHQLLAAGTAKTEPEAKAIAASEFAKQYPFLRASASKSAK